MTIILLLVNRNIYMHTVIIAYGRIKRRSYHIMPDIDGAGLYCIQNTFIKTILQILENSWLHKTKKKKKN